MAANTFSVEFARGGFGKLPAFDDFVRVSSNGPEAQLLDRWLHDGLSYHAQKELGPEWEACYDANLYHRFVFRPDKGTQTLAGVIRAAMDQHGRRFPYALFGILPTSIPDQHPLWIPMLNDLFFNPLEIELEQIALCFEVAEVRERLRAPGVLTPPDRSTRARYRVFLEEVSCGEMGFGPDEHPTGPLEELVSVFNTGISQRHLLPTALSFPLGQPEYARGLEMSFWIELSLILVRSTRSALSLFWTSSQAPATQPYLVVVFGQPEEALMAALLRPEGLGRAVWRPGQSPPLFPREKAGTKPPLTVDPDKSLLSLMESVCPGYPHSCEWNNSIEESPC